MELKEIEELVKKEVSKAKDEVAPIVQKAEGLAKKYDLFHIILTIIAVLALSSFVWNTYFKPANPVTQSEFVGPPIVKELEKIKPIPVPAPQYIYIYPTNQVDQVLGGLPPSFKNNTTTKIIASAQLEPSKTGYKVLGTLVTKDGIGKGGILAEERERSLMGFPNNISIGGRYGVTTDLAGKQQADLYGKWQPLRLGNVYLGAYGEVNSRPEAKAMIDIEYKWKSD